MLPASLVDLPRVSFTKSIVYRECTGRTIVDQDDQSIFSNGVNALIANMNTELTWLEARPQILLSVQRGVEREALRVTATGRLARTQHPIALGAALTHPWITTDFAEAMLEFTTPVKTDVENLLSFLDDLHGHTLRHIGDERLWPLSLPCLADDDTNIALAHYGSSNLGRFKHLYRQGLQQRYGASMQCIAGLHYNFSLPLAFWQAQPATANDCHDSNKVSAGYFRIIRNYYRFGWIIPYLFGASPIICDTFLSTCNTALPLVPLLPGIWTLPGATSLRLSDIGYRNHSLPFDLQFNTLSGYLSALQTLLHTPSPAFAKLGIKIDGEYQQLNSNVLQTENELYTPIRPKQLTQSGETPSEALLRRGVAYIEVRALDINPFAPAGVTAQQLRFLDLFLLWCALADASPLVPEALQCCQHNWQRISVAGRQPDQYISFDDQQRLPVADVGSALFADLRRLAMLFDLHNHEGLYQQVCDDLAPAVTDPTLTLSARIITAIQQENRCLRDFGLTLAQRHRQQLIEQPLTLLTETVLAQEQQRSLKRQRELEQHDLLSFEQYLAHH